MNINIIKKQKKPLSILFMSFIALGLILIIGIVFTVRNHLVSEGDINSLVPVANGLLQRQQVSQSDSEQDTDSGFLPITAVQPSVDTTNWTSYTDSEAGFSLSYPNDWSFEVTGFAKTPETISDQPKAIVRFANFEPPFVGLENSIPDGGHFRVFISNNVGNFFSDDEIGSHSPLSTLKLDNLTVGNLPAVLKTYTSGINSVSVANNRYVFTFQFWSTDIDNYCTNEFEGILDSVDFYE